MPIIFCVVPSPALLIRACRNVTGSNRWAGQSFGKQRTETDTGVGQIKSAWKEKDPLYNFKQILIFIIYWLISAV